MSLMCAHTDAIAVESVVTGEVVAALCLSCDQQLPAEFLTGKQTGAIAQLVAAGWDPASVHRAVESNNPTLLIHTALDSNLSFENIETLRARFLAAQRKPYRTLLL